MTKSQLKTSILKFHQYTMKQNAKWDLTSQTEFMAIIKLPNAFQMKTSFFFGNKLKESLTFHFANFATQGLLLIVL